MRALLVLGRVSNLPTVWSNCLAAWLLAGGGNWTRFLLVCLGATLLYTGGMFLNDAVDVGFDRRYRPERPIPAGQIGARAVWSLSVAWLAAGWAVFLFLGKPASQWATVLVLAIVGYDLVHKRTRLAPLVMASCRLLLYFAAAGGLFGGAIVHEPVFWRAVALAAYIIGLSFLARGESTGKRHVPWTLVLLFTPVLVAYVWPLAGGLVLIAGVVLEAAWTLWSLSSWRPRWVRFLPKGVAGLLAGIVLVDWLAAAGHGGSAVFAALFLAALSLQRIAPAT